MWTDCGAIWCTSTQWQEVRTTQMLLLIDVSNWPVACICCFTSKSKHQRLLRAQASLWNEGTWESGNSCLLFLLCTTTTFSWAVQSSVCILLDMFFHQDWGVLYDPFEGVQTPVFEAEFTLLDEFPGHRDSSRQVWSCVRCVILALNYCMVSLLKLTLV